MSEQLIMLIFLMVLLIFTEIRNYKERRELIEKIMAKNLTELSYYELEPKRVQVKDQLKKEGIEL